MKWCEKIPYNFAENNTPNYVSDLICINWNVCIGNFYMNMLGTMILIYTSTLAKLSFDYI